MEPREIANSAAIFKDETKKKLLVTGLEFAEKW